MAERLVGAEENDFGELSKYKRQGRVRVNRLIAVGLQASYTLFEASNDCRYIVSVYERLGAKGSRR